MGYYSIIENYSLRFQNMHKYWDYLLLDDKKKYTGENPFYENFDLDQYHEDLETEITIAEPYSKMGEYKEWIPFFAEYLEGYMEIQGDEPSDMWKIVFNGDGTYDLYVGSVSYDIINLEDL